jgi:hypothetical protein
MALLKLEKCKKILAPKKLRKCLDIAFDRKKISTFKVPVRVTVNLVVMVSFETVIT